MHRGQGHHAVLMALRGGQIGRAVDLAGTVVTILTVIDSNELERRW